MHRTASLVLGVLVLLAILVSAQGTAPASPSFYQVCSKTQSQPCATQARAINQPDPEYSDEARRLKVHGTTGLNAIVGVDGRLHDIRVVQRLGHGLDEKAIEALKIWTFDPGTKDGKPVPVQLGITIEFHLYER